MIKLYTDAAVLNHEKKSAGGILIIIDHQQHQIKLPLPAEDNHNAEFATCLAGFKKILTMIKQPAEQIVTYYTDSKIVYDSLEKHYAKHYQAWVDQIIPLEQRFSIVLNNLVDDRHNGAHQLAQQALHQS